MEILMVYAEMWEPPTAGSSSAGILKLSYLEFVCHRWNSEMSKFHLTVKEAIFLFTFLF